MRRSEKSHLPVVAVSHPGMRGKKNEDRYGISAFRKGGRTPVLLAVLSDGIGGHRAGEVAAEIAVDSISGYVADNGSNINPTQMLQAAISLASQAIFDQARANHQQEGMGATCACVYVEGNALYTASVGDSRIYLLRGGILQQLSVDHTWVQEAMDKGALRPDQIQGHPNQHIIRRFLGSPFPPEADLRLRLSNGEGDVQSLANQGTALQVGDILLLCSDGLTDLVSDAEIEAALMGGKIETAVDDLVELANQRGGHDNITLVALTVTPEALALPARAMPTRRWLLTGCAAVIALAALAGLVAWGLYSYFNPDSGGPGTTAAETSLPGVQPLLSPTVTRAAATPNPSLAPLVVTPPPGTPIPGSGGGPTLTPWPTYTQAP